MTDGGRSVLARPDDFESLSSGGYDMAEVGVTRFPTPSTPRTTPAASPAPRGESPLYAAPERPRRPEHAVVVAIDFGTTYSGYAFSFVSSPGAIHVMRRAAGGDPGLNNQKTPTALLLSPEAEFSAFGFAARDAYHDLEPRQAAEWLYFDKFKLSLHTDASLGVDTYIPAANGQCISALLVFAHALSFFRRQALDELDDLLGYEMPAGQIRWVITVPAIWRQHAKQFMRQAAYKAGLCSEGRREDLLIALEPEVASVYCHSLRLHELVHEGADRVSVYVPSRGEEARTGAAVQMVRGTRYLVVDCGGGTVDITVHEVLDSEHRRLKEVYKASGGPYGSVGVDMQFESLLGDIFGAEFVSGFRSRRPAAWIDLMVAFEARKRAASPDKASPLNVALPFAFISEFKKVRGKKVEQAVKNYRGGQVRYTDGMLRLDSELMQHLFAPTLDKITEQVESLFDMVSNMQYLFLVGGFSESKLLQERMKRTFSDRIKVVIPQEVSLAILRGAVLFGLDPSVIQVRRCTMTYGVGVLNKFMRGIHPQGKLLVRDGREWCADIFDKFVTADQSVGVGETLLRRYTPARADQTTIVLHLYCSHKEKVMFVTDDGVEKCGTLKLILEGTAPSPAKRREIQVRMRFGDTEILASAVDLVSQRSVTAHINFLNL
ncbi:heat shock 70 kDa protein 12A-like [Amphibalanus amphitrite]|uniref:heat shock 70 kDa protein 12A-like n=1 Tax=Amphibalanus amphitrite TaxID=1232801 RepID=UPI001C909855|nr:heat shock 70 kDa protein 12A-like [Amphibalanus amphitrite]